MKRLLIGAFAALMAVAAMATTPSPVSLLNTAGSTAGQAIVSSGPTSTAGWGNVSAAALTGITPVVNGGTGVTTAPAELSRIGAAPLASPTFTGTVTIPGGASVAGYLTTASAASTYAPLASPTFTGTATAAALTATGLITPSTTIGIKGTAAADSAQAGSVGEYANAVATGIALTTNIAANVTSITLTAGDWDVSGTAQITAAGSTVMSNAAGGISTTSATLGSLGTFWQLGATLPAGANLAYPLPKVRVNISSTTTVYLIALSTFSTSTCAASGTLTARRIR